MNPRSFADLRGLLLAEGFDAGDPDHWRARIRTGPATPWYVRILVGFGAWVAALMLALALAVLLSFDRHGPGLLILGLLVCAGSTLLRNFTKGDFPAQFALSMSLAGQIMFGVGLGMRADHGMGWGPWFAAMTLLQGLLLVVYRDPVHRFLTAAAGVLLFTFLLEHYRLAWFESALVGLGLLAWGLLPAPLWRGPLRDLRRPVGYAFASVFLGLYTWHSLERMVLHPGRGSSAWAVGFEQLPAWLLGALVPGLLLAALVLRILLRLQRPGAWPAGLLVLGAVLCLSLLGIPVPGIPAMLFVLVLAAEAREPAMFGLAVVAGLFLVTRLYYQLDLSLLAKSGVLAGSGAVLLGLRAALGGRFRP